MAALTGRYTNSPESRFESDLSLLRDLEDGTAFLSRMRDLCATALTSDFWSITLPNQLATSAARSPSLFGYHAALIKLDAPALYSPIKIADLADPAIKGTKAAIEQHHLFPRAYLESIDITDLKQINQIANFAWVEWPDNIRISKQAPSEYAPSIDAKLSGWQRESFYFCHALPPLWWELPYEQFLVERRSRMAMVILEAWNRLRGGPAERSTTRVSVAELLERGETDAIEFKSTLRTNLHTGQHDDKMQLTVLKTIAGFLNSKGGTLLIGVADNGDILGLGADGFSSEDKMQLHLVNLVKDRIGEVFLPYIHAHFEEQDEQRVLAIYCERGPKAAFVKDGGQQRFYVRGGNATAELQGSSITDYVRQRFE